MILFIGIHTLWLSVCVCVLEASNTGVHAQQGRQRQQTRQKKKGGTQTVNVSAIKREAPLLLNTTK